MIRPEIQAEIDATTRAFSSLRRSLNRYRARIAKEEKASTRAYAAASLMTRLAQHTGMGRYALIELLGPGGVKSSAALLDRLSQVWPADLDWPAHIERPSQKGGTA